MKNNKNIIKYIYSKVNYSQNRKLYMYSTHNWDTFLTDYFNDRTDLLRKIKRKALDKNRFLTGEDIKNLDIIDINKFNPIILIEYLLSIPLSHPKFSDIFLFFLRMFETKGKIIFDCNNKIECELLPIDYLKLSYCISKFLKRSYNMKYLNFFLKLNDKIIFMKDQWLGNREEAYFIPSILCELEIIKKLIS